jgi:hypothetical protein
MLRKRRGAILPIVTNRIRQGSVKKRRAIFR